MLDMEAIKNFSIDKSDWKKVKFGDVVFEPKESVKDPVAEGIKHVVGLEHITSEDIHLRRSAGIEESTTFTKKFSQRDVLFGRRRAYLKKAAKANFEGICSGDITVMRAVEELLIPELLPFIVNNDRFFDYAVQHSAGGLSPRVKFKDLSNFELSLPVKTKQKDLLQLLNSLDSLIENNKLLTSQLKKNLITIREKNLCSSDFEKVRLAHVLDNIIAGKSLNGENIPVSNEEKGVLKVSAVGAEGFVCNENKRLINQKEYIPKHSVKAGDVLITRANTTELVGRVCLVSKSYPNLMLSDKTLKLNFLSEKVDKVYISEVLNSLLCRNQIEAFATGTGGAMKNISQQEIRSLKVPMPPVKMQQEYGRNITSIRNTIQQSVLYGEKLFQIRSDLINKVF
ncbi:restriction endonuclease subunit S [Pseudoalteromonas sp. MMG013]|uniref:restriction endonuclease subunit S n=1 Tax=Pseudoalteromonas sp. MMG013 TaxID=2822687 RepID=UPI001B3732AD|nr:restriction endonuclease subunit S [Pseudoalteromonas sp. MMG013]MBQ4864709.1 restriction endonuclease subunit S [Pseudoalteromonas sp. MMG013]